MPKRKGGSKKHYWSVPLDNFCSQSYPSPLKVILEEQEKLASMIHASASFLSSSIKHLILKEPPSSHNYISLSTSEIHSGVAGKQTPRQQAAVAVFPFSRGHKHLGSFKRSFSWFPITSFPIQVCTGGIKTSAHLFLRYKNVSTTGEHFKNISCHG